MNTTTRTAAASVALLLSMSACAARGGNTDSIGISDDEIVLGSSGPFSGSASAYKTITDGAKACVDAVNASGGVKMGDGKTRTLKLITLDDAYEPGRALGNARELVEKDQVFALFNVVGTSGNLAIMDYANQNKVPQLLVSSGASVFGEDPKAHPYTMGFAPTYSTEAAILVRHIEEENPKATLAVLYQNDDIGTDYMAGLKDALADSTVSLIAEEKFEVTVSSVDSQVVNLARSKADVFLNLATPKFAAQAIRKKAQLGWNATQYVGQISASTQSTLEPAGLENSKGIISAFYVKDLGAPDAQADPAVKDYIDTAEKYGDFDPMDPLGERGFVYCRGLVKVLESMKEPTREAMMDAARNMNFTDPLLIDGITAVTGPDDYYPVEAMRLSEFDGKEWQPLGDPISTDGES